MNKLLSFAPGKKTNSVAIGGLILGVLAIAWYIVRKQYLPDLPEFPMSVEVALVEITGALGLLFGREAISQVSKQVTAVTAVVATTDPNAAAAVGTLTEPQKQAVADVAAKPDAQITQDEREIRALLLLLSSDRLEQLLALMAGMRAERAKVNPADVAVDPKKPVETK